jgi:hypothetical protein
MSVLLIHFNNNIVSEIYRMITKQRIEGVRRYKAMQNRKRNRKTTLLYCIDIFRALVVGAL